MSPIFVPPKELNVAIVEYLEAEGFVQTAATFRSEANISENSVRTGRTNEVKKFLGRITTRIRQKFPFGRKDARKLLAMQLCLASCQVSQSTDKSTAHSGGTSSRTEESGEQNKSHQTPSILPKCQIDELERLFIHDHYPDSRQVAMFSACVGLSEDQIQAWFENRRADWRKSKKAISMECKIEELEDKFEESHHLVIQQLGMLVNRIELTEKQIQGWFQNHCEAHQDAARSEPADLRPTSDVIYADQECNEPHYYRGTAQKMIAKYDYDVYHSSPNIDAEQMEMSFRRGDEIVVFGEVDEDGFYQGENINNGKRGLVPPNFLTPASTSEASALSTVTFDWLSNLSACHHGKELERSFTEGAKNSKIINKAARDLSTTQGKFPKYLKGLS